MKRTKLTKQERGWALYDLSSSAITLMLTAIIPIYIKSVAQSSAITDAQSTAHWGFVNSGATLVLAFLAPIIGALADFKGNKNRIFNLFFIIGIIAIFTSAFINSYTTLLIVNLILIFGYNGTYVIYDAFLVDVTPNNRMDYVSSYGYGIGYIGSCVPFILSLGLIMFEPFGLAGAVAVKVSLLLNGIWWLLFSIPFLRNVKQVYCIEKTEHVAKQIIEKRISHT